MSYTNRRTFLNIAAAGAVTAGLASPALATPPDEKRKQPASALAESEPVVTPVLPYAADALAPHISAETISFHHGKHTVGYYTKLVELLGPQINAHDLPTLVQLSARGEGKLNRDVFNPAAQLWNHNFYWRGLRPAGAPASASAPQGPLRVAIERQFGTVAKLLEMIQKDAVALFGSGWVWLVMDQDGRMSLKSTSNADTPLTEGLRPLWVIDVWEHAYYIDVRNKRPAHVSAVLQNLINWDFVGRNYSRA